MRNDLLSWAGIILVLVAGVVLVCAGTQAKRHGAFQEEMLLGDQALAAGATSRAARHYEAARELPGADTGLVSLKLGEAYYMLAEGYYREWAALSDETVPSVVYDLEKAEFLATVQAKPAVRANYEAAVRNFEGAIEEAQKVERFPDEGGRWWKGQYLLGNSYFRTLVMMNKSPGDPRGAKVKRLFRECVQSYKNALAGRPSPMTEADRVWDTYIKQNLELALAMEGGFVASIEAQESEIESMWGEAKETSDEQQQSPLKVLSPGEKDTLEKGGRVGVGELGGEK